MASIVLDTVESKLNYSYCLVISDYAQTETIKYEYENAAWR